MEIRKISVGADYKNSMNYIVGQKCLEDHHINCIQKSDNETIKIWIMNEKQEVLLWKEFTQTIPISIEYNINF
jgi:hypothetical protein